MARVKGPLMSMTASGSIAQGGLQFRQTRHGPQVVIPALSRQEKHPTTPSTAQLRQRADFTAARDQWRALDEAERSNWREQARAMDAPNGWSLFLRHAIGPGFYPTDFLTTPDGQAIKTRFDGWLTI